MDQKLAQQVEPVGDGLLYAIRVLEKPRLVRTFAESTTSVYCAKALQGGWKSELLQDAVAKARESYQQVYGQDVSLFDSYDEKARVYLAVTTSNVDGTPTQEALTLRFVPAWGPPLLTDDLRFYKVNNAGLLPWLQRALKLSSSATLLQSCYSQSRMGAIRPEQGAGRHAHGNHHVGTAWAMMLETFLADAAADGMPCSLLTSQTNRLLNRLGYRIKTHTAEEFLGVQPGSVRLDRTDPRTRALCYSVPTYFLSLPNTSLLLQRLLTEGRLDKSAVEAVVAQGVSLSTALKHPRPSYLPHLGQLFSQKGRIAKSQLTGEQLRAFADEHVGDGPTLRITLPQEANTEITRLRQSSLPPPRHSLIRLREQQG